VTELDVAAWVLGLLCLVVAAFGVVARREDRTRSMNWRTAGVAVLGAGFVALAVSHWLWLIGVVAIGGLVMLVAHLVGEWRGE
jgi:uncharacterized membrane protein YhaH (DUF805 family)